MDTKQGAARFSPHNATSEEPVAQTDDIYSAAGKAEQSHPCRLHWINSNENSTKDSSSGRFHRTPPASLIKKWPRRRPRTGNDEEVGSIGTCHGQCPSKLARSSSLTTRPCIQTRDSFSFFFSFCQIVVRDGRESGEGNLRRFSATISCCSDGSKFGRLNCFTNYLEVGCVGEYLFRLRRKLERKGIEDQERKRRTRQNHGKGGDSILVTWSTLHRQIES